MKISHPVIFQEIFITSLFSLSVTVIIPHVYPIRNKNQLIPNLSLLLDDDPLIPSSCVDYRSPMNIQARGKIMVTTEDGVGPHRYLR